MRSSRQSLLEKLALAPRNAKGYDLPTMHPQVAPARCLDREALIEDIRATMDAVVALNTRQMEAVMMGQFALLSTIKGELVEVRKRKDSLLEAYYTHLREHGC